MRLLEIRSQSKTPTSERSIKKQRLSSGRVLITMTIILGIVLFAGGVFAVGKMMTTNAAAVPGKAGSAARITTINGLQKILQVGSTATVLNAQGQQVMVDPNPYKIAIAPAGLANGLKAGDLVVSNIGNMDHGVTLVKFAQQKGPGQIFNAPNAGVLGASSLAFDAGKLLVANAAGNNVLVLNPDGTLLTAITSPLFNAPWGIAAGGRKYDGNSMMLSFFVTNKLDAKILRVDIVSRPNRFSEFRVTQIGQFFKNGDATKIDIHWLPELRVGKELLKDVLLALDPLQNRVAAYPNSSVLRNSVRSTTIFQGKPLNEPGGMAINPLNGDLLVVNLMDNNLVELNLTTGKVVGVKQIDPAAVDNQGNGSALFGVAAIKDAQGNLRVFFTDDNTNSLDVLQA